MDGTKNFRVIDLGPVDGSALKEWVDGLPGDVWHRNGAAMAAQANTMSVPVLEQEDIIGGKDITPAVCKPLQTRAINLVQSVLCVHLDVEEKFSVVGLMVARLLPGAEVFVHMDADYGTPQYAFWQGLRVCVCGFFFVPLPFCNSSWGPTKVCSDYTSP